MGLCKTYHFAQDGPKATEDHGNFQAAKFPILWGFPILSKEY